MSKLNKNYLSPTFLIMLASWGICLLFSLNGTSLNDNKLLYVPYVAGGLSPAIASYFSLKRCGEVAGFKDWLKNVFDFKHSIHPYRQYYLVAVASAFVFHTGSQSVRAKLFRIRHQRIRTGLRSGKYKKKYGQHMALCIIPQHDKFFIRDL